MAPKKQLRQVLGIFKDKVSLIRTNFSTKRTTSKARIAVIRCTTHFVASTPSEYRIATLVSLGKDSRYIGYVCVEAIMNRLHNTTNSYVALKCLFTLHNVIAKEAFVLLEKDSLLNSLNLSTFFDDFDADTCVMSSWVRWYATILEGNLITSEIIGFCFSNDNQKEKKEKKKMEEKAYEILKTLMNFDLLREIEALVMFIEEICRAPGSLDCLRNNLVYEVVKMVSEDYRLSQRFLTIRLGELVCRMDGLTRDECAELTRCFEQLEGCREKLSLLFGNRKRNDAFWELVQETKGDVLAKMERRLVVKYEGESTRWAGRVVEQVPVLRLLPYGGG